MKTRLLRTYIYQVSIICFIFLSPHVSFCAIEKAPFANSELGKVIESFDGSDQKNVIIITDAHCNFKAQKNIASILRIYTNTDATQKLIGLEGASGNLYTKDLRSFPIKETKEKIASFFLKNGKLNGVEYFNIISNPTEKLPLTVGIEEADLYRTSLNTYLSIAPHFAKTRQLFKNLLFKTTKISDKTFNPLQKQFTAIQSSVQTGEISYLKFCKYILDLAGQYNQNIENFTNLDLLNQSMIIENSLDSFKLALERKEISKLISDPDFDKINRRFDLGFLKTPQFYAELEKYSKNTDIDLADYRETAKYMAYSDKTSAINHAKLYAESLRLSDTIAGKIYDIPSTKETYDWSQRFTLMLKLLNLDISFIDYKTVKKESSVFNSKNIISFFNKHLSEKIILPDSIDNHIAQSMSFYQMTDDRNKVMTDNLLAEMTLEECNTAILVVGGFHMQGIASILRNRDISYCIISPNMDGNDHIYLYRQRLASKKTPFEQQLEDSIRQIISQNKSSLPSKDTLAIASYLAEKTLIDKPEAMMIRVELKSLMTAQAIQHMESIGLHDLDDLKDKIQAQLIDKWANSYFPELNSYSLSKAPDGDLVIELTINNNVYTFFTNIPEDTPPYYLKNRQELDRLNGESFNIVVTSGSYTNLKEPSKTTDILLRQLAKSDIAVSDIQTKYNVSDTASLVHKWEKSGLIEVVTENNIPTIRLRNGIKELIPLAELLQKQQAIDTQTIKQYSAKITENLDRFNVKEILVEKNTPLTVLIHFLAQLSSNIDAGFEDSLQIPVLLYEIHGNMFYSAETCQIGMPIEGTRIELRTTNLTNIPFGESTRDRKTQAIQSQKLLSEVISPNPTEKKPNTISLRNTPNDSPPIQNTTLENKTIDRLFRFIGDPDSFADRQKALVFDLDGTISKLLDGELQIVSEKIIKHIEKFIEQGFKIAIVSGASYEEIDRRFLSLINKKLKQHINVYAHNGNQAIHFDENGNEKEIYSFSLASCLKSNTTTLTQLEQKIDDLTKSLGITNYKKYFYPGQFSIKLFGKDKPKRDLLYRSIHNIFNENVYGLEIGIAGRSTVDISVENKYGAVMNFARNNTLTPHDILFFGDSYHGNDCPMAYAFYASTHFHVGSDKFKDRIADNVTITEGEGPDTTLKILNRLDQIIDLTVTKQFNEIALRKILKNNNSFFDFHRQYSKETPPEQLEEKSILFPIWFTTNESAWEKPIEQMEQGNHSNVMIGVGAGGVSLSYIAAANPEFAVIMDYNPMITQLFVPLRNSLISFANNRIEFLSLLSGKPIKRFKHEGRVFYTQARVAEGSEAVMIPEDASVAEILALFNRTEPNENYHKNVINGILPLFPEKLRPQLLSFWTNNYGNGFKHRFVLKSMIEAEKRAGKPITWLSNEDRFGRVKKFIEEGRLLSAEVDWSSETATNIASMLASKGKTVDIMYLSNMHEKITHKAHSDGSKPYVNYEYNTQAFPKTDRSLILTDRAIKQKSFTDQFIFKHGDFPRSYLEAELLHFREKMYKNKPILPSKKQKILEADYYSDFITKKLTDLGRPDLAEFYKKSDVYNKKEMLNFFSDNIIEMFKTLRSKIEKNQPLTSEEYVLSIELSDIFGYGLKDMEKVLKSFNHRYDFLLRILTLPYSRGKIFMIKTAVQTETSLVDTMEIFRREPDIMLIQSDMITSESSPENFLMGKSLDQYRKEHVRQNRRLVKFIIVDTASDSIIIAKKKIDKVLYTRGENNNSFDNVIALKFDPENPSEKENYETIVKELGQTRLEKMARNILRKKRLAIMPSPEDIKREIHKIVLSIRENRIISNALSSYGIKSKNFASRVSIISYKNSFLETVSKEYGLALRSIDKETNHTQSKQGLFLIDLLRSISEIPKNTIILGINPKVSIPEDFFEQEVDIIMSLSYKLSEIYADLSETKKDVTFQDMYHAVKNAMKDHLITPKENLFMRRKLRERTTFLSSANLDKIFDVNLIFKTFIDTDLLKNSNRTIAERLLLKQIKLIKVNEILNKAKLKKQVVTLIDIQPDLKTVDVNIQDISSHILIDIPARPISNSLSNAIMHQRALDLSA